MSLEEPEEDYWGSSRVKSSKKKVNIFDENVTVEAAKDLVKFQTTLKTDDDFFDDDDTELIDWKDEPVPLSGTPTGSVSSLPRPSFEPQFESSQPLSSFQTHSRSKSDVAVGRLGDLSFTRTTSISDSRRDKKDSEPDLSTVIRQNSPFSSGGQVGGQVTQRERSYTGSQQEQKIRYLEQQLALATSAGGSSKLTVDEAVMRLLHGQPVSLEHFKSKEEKVALLDKAIASHDGNAIISAVVFMKQTLRKQLFHLELLRRPAAIDQYLAYLKAQFNVDEYSEMLELLPDRKEELAMFRYKQAVKVEDPVTKIRRLQTCRQTFFETMVGMEHECNMIQQQISLLHRQQAVNYADDELEKLGKHLMFNQVPRAASIINMPVITTLYYCCLYHYNDGENLLSSPSSIKKDHQLTDKQYIWTAAKARARVHKWAEIDALFITKGFFGSTKMKSPIGFHRVAVILSKAGASPDIVCSYLMLVEDVTTRLELAQKLQCPDAVVETYKAQRDRQALSAYLNKMKQHTREWYLAKKVLNDQSIKWKS